MKRLIIVLLIILAPAFNSRLQVAAAFPAIDVSQGAKLLPGLTLSPSMTGFRMEASKSESVSIVLSSIAPSAPAFEDCTLYPGEIHEKGLLAAVFSTYISRRQNNPPGIRKADLLFPFNCFW